MCLFYRRDWSFEILVSEAEEGRVLDPRIPRDSCRWPTQLSHLRPLLRFTFALLSSSFPGTLAAPRRSLPPSPFSLSGRVCHTLRKAWEPAVTTVTGSWSSWSALHGTLASEQVIKVKPCSRRSSPGVHPGFVLTVRLPILFTWFRVPDLSRNHFCSPCS